MSKRASVAEQTAPASVIPPAKKQKRPGVGTSVAQLSFGPLDNLILLTAKLQVEQLRPRQAKIQTVKRSDTVSHLFEVLIANNILSCPVVNNNGKYYGFVDMRDIVVYASSMFPEHSKDRLVKLLLK